MNKKNRSSLTMLFKIFILCFQPLKFGLNKCCSIWIPLSKYLMMVR